MGDHICLQCAGIHTPCCPECECHDPEHDDPDCSCQAEAEANWREQALP